MSEYKCSNCSSSERYTKDVDIELLPIGAFWSWGKKFTIQVCGGCGLVEWFVPARLLPKVKDRFDRAV
jgi:hypothetical protein